MSLSVIVFGATGTAGAGVLDECAESHAVARVTAVVRRALPAREKVTVRVTDDLLDLSAIRDAFAGVDACFYCLGKSVSQVASETEYRRITIDMPMAAARVMRDVAPRAQFHYLSGSGASRTSRMMWARVKGEAEQQLMDAYGATCWRPGFIDGVISASAPASTRMLAPLFRLLRPFKGMYVHSTDIGAAMIRATTLRLGAQVIDNERIRELAAEQLLEEH